MIPSKRITDLLRFDRPFNMEEKMILRDHLALERTCWPTSAPSWPTPAPPATW
jgi:hypothetical protein